MSCSMAARHRKEPFLMQEVKRVCSNGTARCGPSGYLGVRLLRGTHDLRGGPDQAGHSRTIWTTIHQSYSYEEFILGVTTASTAIRFSRSLHGPVSCWNSPSLPVSPAAAPAPGRRDQPRQCLQTVRRIHHLYGAGQAAGRGRRRDFPPRSPFAFPTFRRGGAPVPAPGTPLVSTTPCGCPSTYTLWPA